MAVGTGDSAGAPEVFATNAERIAAIQETIKTIGDEKAIWQKTVDRSKNALIGDRFIIIDKHQRAYKLVVSADREGTKVELSLPDPSLIGVYHLTAERAAIVCADMQKNHPEFGPYVARDFEDFAREQIAESNRLIGQLEGKIAAGGLAGEVMVQREASLAERDSFPVEVDRREQVREKLAAIGFDSKTYDDQMHARMIVERATSLDDEELRRVFDSTVLADFNIRYMTAARQAGLTIEDVYADVHGGHVVVVIETTDNAAFIDVGRDQEVARIFDELSWKVEDTPDLSDDSITLRDVNGNVVGELSYERNPPNGAVADGAVRLVIATQSAAFVEGVSKEVARLIGVAAEKIRDGDKSFKLLDANGNAVGSVELRDPPSLEKDGRIDMAMALGDRKVFWADDSGMMALAEGEYRFVGTSGDFTPGYGEGEGPVWLVNANGEKAPSYDDPQVVRELEFRALTKDEGELLRQVIDGSLSFEEFEARFDDDTPEIE